MALTAVLRQPHGLPRGTWRSPQFQAVAHSVDAYCLLLTTLNNLLALSIRVAKRSTHIPTAVAPAFSAVVLLSLLPILFGTLQLLLCHTNPALYFRYRPHVLIGARILRMLGFLEWTLQMRAWLAAPSPPAVVAAFTATTPHPPRLAGALNTLLIFSGSLHAIANNVTVPLPLLPQALFQLLYMAVLLKFHARTAAAGLALSQYGGTFKDVCLTLNTVVAVSASAHAGHMINLQELHEACRRDSALLLVVFAQLYFGVAVPLYCTFRMEQEVRQHIQQAVHRGAPQQQAAQPLQDGAGWLPGPHGWAAPPEEYPPRPQPQQQQQGQQQQAAVQPQPAPPQQALSDVALLLMLAATCWLTVVNFLPELVQLSLPPLDRLQLWYSGPRP